MFIRFFLKLFFFVLVARWIGAEVTLVAPGVAPHIDAALQYIAIPTHDQWTEKNFRAAKKTVNSIVAAATSIPEANAQSETVDGLLSHF